MSMHLTLLAAVAVLPLQAPRDHSPAPVTVTTLDGAQVRGAVDGLAGGELRVAVEGRVVAVPWSSVLALHGTAPRPGAAVTVRLVGGDELRGDLRAGDAGGETLVLESRSLGAVAVPVDRVRSVILHALAGQREFSDAERGEQAEVLFVPAKRGFDAIAGAIHRFTSEGVMFAVLGNDTPRLFPYARLAGLAVRDGQPPDTLGDSVLVTRSGDVVAVRVVELTATGLVVEGERARRATLPWSEVATLLRRGSKRVFVSDLTPELVDEASFFGDGAPLFPWRPNRNVSGGFLVANGLTYARGLGVHSRSNLTFRVPAGAARFQCLVAIDDEVLALPARGVVDIAVLLDGQEVLARKGIMSGGPAINLGAIPVRAGAVLTLRVEHGAGLDLGDHVDWLHAVFLPEVGS